MIGTDKTEVRTRTKRSDSITSWNSFSREAVMSKTNQSNSLGASLLNGSSPSIKVFGEHVHGRAWENDMENLLKVDFIIFMINKRSLICFGDRKSTMQLKISRSFNR